MSPDPGTVPRVTDTPAVGRFDPYEKVLLRTEEGGDVPLVASLCTECGAVVIDRAVHDRWHSFWPLPPVHAR